MYLETTKPLWLVDSRWGVRGKKSRNTFRKHAWMWEGKGFRGFHTIEYRSELYNLLDKSSLPPVVIKKVVLEHNHIICFQIAMSAFIVQQQS